MVPLKCIQIIHNNDFVIFIAWTLSLWPILKIALHIIIYNIIISNIKHILQTNGTMRYSI